MQITYSEKPAKLTESCERSTSSQNILKDARSRQAISVDSIAATRSSDTLFATVEFELKESMEPDIETPKTIAELAEEQRQFIASLDEYIDVDLPFDN